MTTAPSLLDVDPEKEVLVDRYVLFEDELSRVIEEMGGTPPSLNLESVLEKIRAMDLSSEEMEATVQRAIEDVMLRYRADVELPAEVLLRERKASRPSAVEKVPVAVSGDDKYDAAFYREALDGIEPNLRKVDSPLGLTSLVLRVSWPGDSALRQFPAGAFISSADHNILVLYVGPYRPCLAAAGFYLVYDAWANSVAVVPRLPSKSVTLFSHCSIGTGVAVLRHSLPSDYVLVELLPRQDNQGLISNMATFFMWRSSGPVAGQWIQKEVVLPLPSEPEEHTSQPSYNFCADTVFAVGTTCLCWADLLQGILICDYVLADYPEFRFVELPFECTVNSKPDPEDDRGLPSQYRSMCCVKRGDGHIIKFISMHGHGQGDISGMALTIWTLDQPCNPMSKWKAGSTSFRISDLWSDPMYKSELLLPPCTPSCPVISLLDDDFIYISVDDMLDDCTEAREPCILGLDMKLQRVVSSTMPGPGTRVIPLPDVFASTFITYLDKRCEWSEAMRHKCKEEAGDWRKREKSVMLSTSSDAMRRKQLMRQMGYDLLIQASSMGLAALLDDY